MPPVAVPETTHLMEQKCLPGKSLQEQHLQLADDEQSAPNAKLFVPLRSIVKVENPVLLI